MGQLNDSLDYNSNECESDVYSDINNEQIISCFFTNTFFHFLGRGSRWSRKQVPARSECPGELQEELPPRQIGPAEHQRPGTAPDARPERRPGRATVRHPLRPFALGAQAVQDCHTAARQELHPDAGKRPRGNAAHPRLRQPSGGRPATRSRSGCSHYAPSPGSGRRGVPGFRARRRQGRPIPWGVLLRPVRQALTEAHLPSEISTFPGMIGPKSVAPQDSFKCLL
ncbi:UNVERIFIED_CONTAM: hypothetical protein NCL1_35042 [Trichonephila clavipes]